MATTQNKFLRAACLSFALIGATAFVATMATTDVAYAKSANADKAKDKKPKKEKRAKPTKAAKPIKHVKPVIVAKVKKKDFLAEYGLHASDLGGLNSLFNKGHKIDTANPNSRWGRVLPFRDAVLAGYELGYDLVDAEASLALLKDPGFTSADSQDMLDEAWLAAEPDMVEIEALEAELLAAQDYEAAVAEVDRLTTAIIDQPALERDLLEDAANKPVTDAVEAAVEAMLGLVPPDAI